MAVARAGTPESRTAGEQSLRDLRSDAAGADLQDTSSLSDKLSLDLGFALEPPQLQDTFGIDGGDIVPNPNVDAAGPVLFRGPGENPVRSASRWHRRRRCCQARACAATFVGLD